VIVDNSHEVALLEDQAIRGCATGDLVTGGPVTGGRVAEDQAREVSHGKGGVDRR